MSFICGVICGLMLALSAGAFVTDNTGLCIRFGICALLMIAAELLPLLINRE